MLNVTINKIDYKVAHTWSDIKLKTGIELSVLIENDMPIRIRAYWDTINKLNGSETDQETKKQMLDFEMSITEEENFKTFPLFFGKVMKLLSNIPEEVIDFINPIERTVLFHTYLKEFCWGMLFLPYNFTSTAITEFEIEGIKYCLPADENVMGTVRPMGKNTTAVEFCETADLLTFSKQLHGGRNEAMANVLGVLCRPFDKEGNIVKYDEKEGLIRAELFKKNLTMQTMWEVFFCISEQLTLFTQRTTISSLEEQRARQKLHSTLQDLPDLDGLDIY